MKIVIAPDSFKGNLSALEVANAMEKGVRRVIPHAKCIKVPMADGGEGTVRSLKDAVGGKFIRKNVCGPNGDTVKARYALLADNVTAVIEMAEASGLPLVEEKKRNPLKATTFGTGELIVDAINRGARKIIIGIGGSATNDGGVGMAQALGVSFYDKRSRKFTRPLGGGDLHRINMIKTDSMKVSLRGINIIIASDVDNPLCGKRGASEVFGPQKGASPAMVRKLDANLSHFARIIRRDLKVDVRNMKGAGASGGLGAGLVAFAGAKMRSGIDIVVKASDLKNRILGADLVITGEGRVDFQTAFEKHRQVLLKLQNAAKYLSLQSAVACPMMRGVCLYMG